MLCETTLRRTALSLTLALVLAPAAAAAPAGSVSAGDLWGALLNALSSMWTGRWGGTAAVPAADTRSTRGRVLEQGWTTARDRATGDASLQEASPGGRPWPGIWAKEGPCSDPDGCPEKVRLITPNAHQEWDILHRR